MQLKRIVIYPFGFIAALLICSVLLIIAGIDPFTAYASIFTGSFGSAYAISETLVKMTPLLLTAIAFTLPYRAGFWNIGGEGQLFIGALFATLFAYIFGGMPGGVVIPIVLAGSFLAGILWMIVPVFMKVKLGISEIFVTVILNFVAVLFIHYLTTDPLKEPGNPNPQSAVIPVSAWLVKILPDARIHIGFIIPIIAAVAVYLVLHKTTFGYEVRAIGTSIKAANYAGIKISRRIVISAVVGAGLAGLAGGLEITGIHHFLTARLPPNLGYFGILVAVLGKFNPIWEIPASLFFAAMLVGGETMQRFAGVPYGMIYVLVSLITFIIIAIEKIAERRR